MSEQTHIPVLLSEVLHEFNPQEGETVLDVTLGLGGHAQALQKCIGKNGQLIGLDADQENLSAASVRLHQDGNRPVLHHANFQKLLSLDIPPVDILFADLGVSSPHFDDPKRGFTFRFDAPLDLRFDQSAGSTAAEFIASVSSEELGRTLHEYGELRQARRIASAMKDAQKMHTTADVKACVERCCGWRAPSVLPQIFQALRIAVNDELGALKALLDAGPKLLKPGGRMGVISYHSLEDRMVKQTFRALAEPVKDSSTGQVIENAPYAVVTRKPIRPSEQEIQNNPRSRSARFRVLKRIF